MTSATFRLYDASEQSQASREDCEAAIGSNAILHLTGTIVEAQCSKKGNYVVFKIDDRWGFKEDAKFGLDLEALEYPGAKETPC